ncbi:MAG: type II toxin-antitoxin system Y4mF family antitoxin [Cyanobacteria bacterium P01_H01_bin.74]
MKHSPESLGQLIRKTRKKLRVTQKELALTSGTGLRFIIDLEKGKPTCQLGKVLMVMQMLGLQLSITLPKGLED